MADSYHIIDGQVVPFHGGRKDTNTDAWRDATPMELQLQSKLCAAEQALEEAADALEAAREDAERWNELCRQIDAGEFHPSILDDAMNMGAGALEMHVDDTIDAAREDRNG